MNKPAAAATMPITMWLKNVVPHLMAKDEKCLRRAGILDCCVPNHNALRWAKAGDVGIESSDFFAGFHQKHAITRNVFSRPRRDFLNCVN